MIAQLSAFLKKENLPSFLLPFSLIKQVYSFKTNLQVLYVIIGAYSFVQNEIYKRKLFLFLCSILAINFLIHKAYLDPEKTIKYIQVIALICVAYYAGISFSNKDFLIYAYTATLLALAISLHNYLLPYDTYKVIRFLPFERVSGIIGEPNFSAFSMILPWVIFYRNKKYLFLIVTTLLAVATQSRGVYVFFVLFLMLELINLASERARKTSAIALISVIILSPFILSLFNQNSLFNEKRKSMIDRNASSRLILSQYYTQIGSEQPFGVGLDNAYEFYKKNGDSFRKKTKKELKTWVETNEQHSLFSQVYSEFGVVVYSILILITIYYSIRVIEIQKIILHTHIISILSPLMFINGLYELTLYLAIGYTVFLIRVSENSTSLEGNFANPT